MSLTQSFKEKVIQHTGFPVNSSILIRDLSYFESDRGIVAYREVGGMRVVAGEPFDFKESMGVWQDFVRDSRKKNLKICGYYTSESFSWNEGVFIPCGTSSIVDLKNWDLKGAEFSESRRAINHKRRKNFEILRLEEFKKREFAGKKLLECFQEWKNQKPLLEVEFIISNQAPDFDEISSIEDWWVLLEGDQVSAYLSLLPYKSGKAYYLDHLIQNPQGDKFALDALIVHVLQNCKERGALEFSFGLNPFDELDWRLPWESLVKMGQYVLPSYSAQGLNYYKSKFGSTDKKTRYLFYEQSMSPIKAFAAMARVSFNWRMPFSNK